MPIYEYVCADCDRRFEALVTASRSASCPTCGGNRLVRQLSVFAVNTRGSSPVPAPCATCGDPRGPGTCSMN